MLAFDPFCYRVGQPNRKLIQIDRKEDVELINALQVLNANQCLYFRDATDEPRFRDLLFKFRHKSPLRKSSLRRRRLPKTAKRHYTSHFMRRLSHCLAFGRSARTGSNLIPEILSSETQFSVVSTKNMLRTAASSEISCRSRNGSETKGICRPRVLDRGNRQQYPVPF
jgi:hypothetical protein